MNTIDKIKFIKVKFEMDIKKLAYLCGIPRKRLYEIENDMIEPNANDKLKIDRMMKVLKMMRKPKHSITLINDQGLMIKDLTSIILSKNKTLCIETKTDIERYLSDVIIESMYLGLMLANNNMDEVVLKKVRNRRK